MFHPTVAFRSTLVASTCFSQTASPTPETLGKCGGSLQFGGGSWGCCCGEGIPVVHRDGMPESLMIISATTAGVNDYAHTRGVSKPSWIVSYENSNITPPKPGLFTPINRVKTAHLASYDLLNRLLTWTLGACAQHCGHSFFSLERPQKPLSQLGTS